MLEDEGRKSESGEQKGLDRILALSDGVFAFAITLLVLSLTVPPLRGARTSLNLILSLSTMSNAFFSYALSFFVIGIWWFAHHRLFRYIVKYDTALMWRNLFFLLFVTIVPFLTQLLGQYGDILITVVIYDAVQMIGGLVLAEVWNYATTHRLIDIKVLTPSQIRNIRLRGLVPSFTFLAAIGVSALFSIVGISPSAANLTLFAMFPLLRISEKRQK